MSSTRHGTKRAAVVIPAGGQGTRMRGRIPKQFLRLGRMSILERTIRAFNLHPEVCEIVIACAPGHEQRVQRLVRKNRFRKVLAIVKGGETRQDSVWNGIQALQSGAPIVLIHDAVRPFVSGSMVTEVIAAATRYGAAVPAMPVKETLLAEGEKGTLNGVIDRSRCWVAQTPQGFQTPLLTRAFLAARKSGFQGTDDASLAMRLEHPVHIVRGSEMNIKITTPRDLQIARLLLKGKK